MKKKVERTACPALDSLYRDTSRRNAQTQAARSKDVIPLDASDVTVKKKRKFSSPRDFNTVQAPAGGSIISSAGIGFTNKQVLVQTIH
jgi:hypothetical protein